MSRYVGKPCNCFACHEAGVTDKPIVFVPPDEFCSKARWLHGYDLLHWYERRDAALARIKAMTGPLAGVAQHAFSK